MTLLRMAAGYRQSAEMIRLRIISLKDEARRAQPTERTRLEQRLVLERYYDRRYHKNDRYTF